MKLIAIDLDGTLLSDDGTISNVNINNLHRVQKQGHIVVISSGRSLHDTKQIMEDAGLDCPIITGNGAVAFYGGKIIQNHYLPVDVTSKMMEIVEENGLYYEMYTKKGVMVEEDGMDAIQKEIKRMQEEVDDFQLEHANHIVDTQYKQHGLIYVPQYKDVDFTSLEVYKIFVLSFNVEQLSKLRDVLIKRNDISLTTSGAQKIEIGNPESSKGNALKFIAGYFGIDLKDTVAIGDNFNDLSMFKVAGMGIAMENAEPIVKEQADYVTKHHNENGVSIALQRHV